MIQIIVLINVKVLRGIQFGCKCLDLRVCFLINVFQPVKITISNVR